MILRFYLVGGCGYCIYIPSSPHMFGSEKVTAPAPGAQGTGGGESVQSLQRQGAGEHAWTRSHMGGS